MTLEKRDRFVAPKEGLGAEKNREIAEALQNGDYGQLLDIISTTPDTDRACEVVVRSAVDFHQVDRADSTKNLIQTALDGIDHYGDALKALVSYTWKKHLRGERFWQNPTNDETLFVDGDGELISFQGEIDTYQQGPQLGMNFIRTLDSYTVLTGPNQGQKFSGAERPIPLPKE